MSQRFIPHHFLKEMWWHPPPTSPIFSVPTWYKTAIDQVKSGKYVKPMPCFHPWTVWSNTDCAYYFYTTNQTHKISESVWIFSCYNHYKTIKKKWLSNLFDCTLYILRDPTKRRICKQDLTKTISKNILPFEKFQKCQYPAFWKILARYKSRRSEYFSFLWDAVFLYHTLAEWGTVISSGKYYCTLLKTSHCLKKV